MNVEYLIQLLENKMIVLTNSKAQAYMIGDLATINSIETEMAGVTDTLYKLRLLLDASLEVGSINTSLVESMKMAPVIITDGSTEPMSQYDITTYATDPLHEQKIADILSAMGPMISQDVIDAYITSEAIGSPVTGEMILNAAQTYNVDVRLMMAIMELDSRFGTAGVAISTLNPGNVGNTGTSTRAYPSWAEGVMAVAKWLDRHRIGPEVPEEVPEVVEEEVVEEETATTSPDGVRRLEVVEEVDEEVLPPVEEPATTTPADTSASSTPITVPDYSEPILPDTASTTQP